MREYTYIREENHRVDGSSNQPLQLSSPIVIPLHLKFLYINSIVESKDENFLKLGMSALRYIYYISTKSQVADDSSRLLHHH
jgi:hypothetical protein